MDHHPVYWSSDWERRQLRWVCSSGHTDITTDKPDPLKTMTACAWMWARWSTGCGCVCLLKDRCGLSGLRDEDKIAEGVKAVIAYAYWLFYVCVCVFPTGCLSACCVRHNKVLRAWKDFGTVTILTLLSCGLTHHSHPHREKSLLSYHH